MNGVLHSFTSLTDEDVKQYHPKLPHEEYYSYKHPPVQCREIKSDITKSTFAIQLLRAQINFLNVAEHFRMNVKHRKQM